MDEGFKRKRRQIIKIGAWIGGGLSFVVFFMMDLLFKDFEQGTWRDAIANDLNVYFSIQLSPSSVPVYIGYVLVLALLICLGALFGIGALMFIEWFFMLLAGDAER